MLWVTWMCGSLSWRGFTTTATIMRHSDSAILKNESHHLACLPIHLALLVKLEKSDIFKLSHSLIDLFPEKCVAWYAAGRIGE